MSAEVVFCLDVILTIDDVAIRNAKDLTVSLEKAEVAASARGNTRWRASVGTPKYLLIDFTLLGRSGDTSFGMWQALWSSGAPGGVGISDAGGSLTLACGSMNLKVSQNPEEVVGADVTLKLAQSIGLQPILNNLNFNYSCRESRGSSPEPPAG